MRLLKSIFHLPFVWPFVLVYLLSSQKKTIDQDIDAFYRFQNKCSPRNHISGFYNKFITYAEFRSLFYYRVGRWIKILSWLYPKQTHLSIDIPKGKLGGGVFIQHGYCSDLSAESIGCGLIINQKVTIGWTHNGCPRIGENVRIGAGAIVIGRITIGDNVKIGAGALVVHDVPDNCTVLASESRFIVK